MSTLAVVIVLGGVTGYAATAIVDRAMLTDNALALGGFAAAGDYRQDVSAAGSSTPVSAAPGKWVTVLSWQFTTHRRGPKVFLTQVTVTNKSTLPAPG